TTGFASPAQGYEEQGIDLNRLLVHNPPATYFFRLDTDEMENLGLPRGTLLIVDRSIIYPAASKNGRRLLENADMIQQVQQAMSNQYVLLRHEGQFLCRLMAMQNGKPCFTNGTTDIVPIPGETEIIGIVTASIKEYLNGS
ncbi:MAG: hypothetical protein FWH41_09100, partial [Treponema sp.]|nr:hypothetical protein [Treponema sp.]